METDMRYRLRAEDGRFAGYAQRPLSASLSGEDTAYIFRDRLDAQAATKVFEQQSGLKVLVAEYPAVRGTLRVGDRVRFAAPQTLDEQDERFEILELRGDRMLVRFLDSGMQIEPTFVYLLDELNPA